MGTSFVGVGGRWTLGFEPGCDGGSDVCLVAENGPAFDDVAPDDDARVALAELVIMRE